MTLTPNSNPFKTTNFIAHFGTKILTALMMLNLLFITSCQPKSNNDNDANQTNNAQSDIEPLRLAVASNLATVLPSIITAYKVDANLPADYKIEVTYASSGKLYAQIMAGAPYDIFLSANQSFPAKLKLAQTNNHTPFTYTRGQLALYSVTHTTNDELSNTPLSNATLTALINNSPTATLALANSDLAPYGASAKAYLESQDLYDDLTKDKRLVQAENISQAFQYTHTGSVDYGFVALSQLLATDVDASHYLTLPVNSYPAILQDGIVVSVANASSAHHFVEFLQSNTAQGLFVEAGYLGVED